MSRTPESQTKRDRRAEARSRAAAEREAAVRRARRRRVAIVTAVVVAGVALVGGGAVGIAALATSGGAPAGGATGTTATMGPEGMALETGTPLAGLTTSTTGATEDGVQCQADEQAVLHIHTHLAVYVNGALRPIPAGVGMVVPALQSTDGGDFYAATKCYYWLHVHAQDGVIHIESPTKTTYTLGQFFAVWRQPLTSTSVAGAAGTQTVYVDGKRYTGDPADIPLGSREDIQIDVGTAVPYRPVDWSHSQL